MSGPGILHTMFPIHRFLVTNVLMYYVGVHIIPVSYSQPRVLNRAYHVHRHMCEWIFNSVMTGCRNSCCMYMHGAKNTPWYMYIYKL